MKKIITIILLILIISCNEKVKKPQPINQNESELVEIQQTDYKTEVIFGGCSQCSCPSWRPDSENPEKCVNIRVPTRVLCQHGKNSHLGNKTNLKDLDVQLSSLDDGVLEHILLTPSDTIDLKGINEQKSFSSDDLELKIQQTIYCLEFDRYESGYYNGQRAQFSVWKPQNGFSCCVIVNISRNNRIIARQRVTVTHNRMLRLLMGSVNGVTQGVSPCN